MIRQKRHLFNKASEQAGDRHADIFLWILGFFYKRERQYDEEGITPEERGERRRDLETQSELISLRQHLKIELDKDPSETTPYLRAALNYLDRFWNNLFAFLKDGSLPIDNNLAERTIRHLTTQRNSMLHFGSDEGAAMAATYHSSYPEFRLIVNKHNGFLTTQIVGTCKTAYSKGYAQI